MIIPVSIFDKIENVNSKSGMFLITDEEYAELEIEFSLLGFSSWEALHEKQLDVMGKIKSEKYVPYGRGGWIAFWNGACSSWCFSPQEKHASRKFQFRILPGLTDFERLKAYLYEDIMCSLYAESLIQGPYNHNKFYSWKKYVKEVYNGVKQIHKDDSADAYNLLDFYVIDKTDKSVHKKKLLSMIRTKNLVPDTLEYSVSGLSYKDEFI